MKIFFKINFIILILFSFHMLEGQIYNKEVSKSLIAKVGKQNITINLTKGDELYVLDSKKKILFKEKDAPSSFEFIDFNEDGHKDISLHYQTHSSEVQRLLLYDAREKLYKEVLNFSNFPVPKGIGHSRYYYSYHANGCADMNWISELFYIKNYNVIKIGVIKGYECEDSVIKDGIYVSTISKVNERLLKYLSISIIYSYKNYKWGFIADYWKRNYKFF